MPPSTFRSTVVQTVLCLGFLNATLMVRAESPAGFKTGTEIEQELSKKPRLETVPSQPAAVTGAPEKSEWMGKHFWVWPAKHPGQTSWGRTQFCKLPDMVRCETDPDQQLVATAKMSFEVKSSPEANWLEIVFSEGTQAFIRPSMLEDSVRFKAKTLTADQAAQLRELRTKSEFLATIYEDDPEAVQRKAATFKATDQPRTKRRSSGVRIGMTMDEVLTSDWGSPLQRHRTITATVVHEQWVYGNDQYLYFDNGRLTSIQQSQ